MKARPLRRFLLRLAGHLGMTVQELETRMDVRELHEWAATASREPLGLERLELLVATLCAMTYNANRGRNAAPSKPLDYMPWAREQPSDGGMAASAAAFRMLAMAGKAT